MFSVKYNKTGVGSLGQCQKIKIFFFQWQQYNSKLITVNSNTVHITCSYVFLGERHVMPVKQTRLIKKKKFKVKRRRRICVALTLDKVTSLCHRKSILCLITYYACEGFNHRVVKIIFENLIMNNVIIIWVFGGRLT